MVQSVQHSELPYVSKITDDLIVMGTEDMEKFEKIRSETTKKTIGTHSDAFHCDEVLATTMLLYTDQFKDSIIFRSRSQEALDKLDILADVGGVYNAETLRFDHHQRTFTEVWDASNPKYEGIKLSSAGLIYKHFGKEVIQNAAKQIWNTTLEGEVLEDIYQKFYKSLIFEVDADDNGVSEAEQMRYQIKSGLSSRIGRYNKEWNAPKDKCQHTQFKKAMKVAEEEFLWVIKDLTQVKLPAFQVTKEAWEKRHEFHPSGEIMFQETMCHWKGAVFELEEKNDLLGQLKFSIAQDARKLWRISTVPPTPNSFDMRVPLCKEWRGLRQAELQKVCGIDDAEFIHATGFCGGAWSKESVIKMAELSLREYAELQKKDN